MASGVPIDIWASKGTPVIMGVGFETSPRTWRSCRSAGIVILVKMSYIDLESKAIEVTAENNVEA